MLFSYYACNLMCHVMYFKCHLQSYESIVTVFAAPNDVVPVGLISLSKRISPGVPARIELYAVCRDVNGAINEPFGLSPASVALLWWT